MQPRGCDLFALDKQLKTVPVRREQIVSLIEAINRPMVAAEGQPNQKARCWIVSARTDAGGFKVWAYLHLSESADCLIYQWEGEDIPARELRAVGEEATNFAESMGFMLEDTRFRNLEESRQEEMMRDLPVFNEARLHASDPNLGATPSSAQGLDDSFDSIEPSFEMLAVGTCEAATASAPPVSADLRAQLIRLLASY